MEREVVAGEDWGMYGSSMVGLLSRKHISSESVSDFLQKEGKTLRHVHYLYLIAFLGLRRRELRNPK